MAPASSPTSSPALPLEALSLEAMSPASMLEVWERGARAGSTGRALLLLSAGLPEAETASLAELPLGRRERLLLELRSRTVGGDLVCTAACPACGDLLEVSLPPQDLLGTGGAPAAGDGEVDEAGGESTFRRGSLELRLRLPTSADVLAAEAAGDETEALRTIVGRCVVAAERDGRRLSPEELSTVELTEEVLAAAGEHLVSLDPLAETLLDLGCAACGHRWTQILDVPDLFFAEIGSQAKRLLREVALLARGYGWSEADILALSPWRRRFYLELLLS